VSNFSKIFEADSIIDKKNLGSHAGYIFYYMMKQLYAHMVDDLENMKDSLIAAEEKIFAGSERRMVEALSNLSRELIDLKQSSRLHKEVIEAFAPVAHTFFGKDFHFYIDDILKEYSKIHELTANNRELLTDLRETNDSLLSTKQNDIMQVFTVITSIVFTLELIAGIFSMATTHTPIIGGPFDFEIITGIMALLALIMLAMFKRKKWL
jgi:magnesium transporter